MRGQILLCLRNEETSTKWPSEMFLFDNTSGAHKDNFAFIPWEKDTIKQCSQTYFFNMR